MPQLNTGSASIYYEEYGTGYPVLLFAPGGMRSAIGAWRRNPANPDAIPPWMDPTQSLADEFRLIAMDQRNAGKSTAPISSTDDWSSFARDHVALLDHLGIDRCHVMGGCIGASYCLGLKALAPSRVNAAVLQNPIGVAGANHQVFHDMFAGWAREISARPDVEPSALERFGHNMFDGDFVFSVTRDFVRSCSMPMLVLPGEDAFHPTALAEEIVSLAPNARLLTPWKGPAHLQSTIVAVRQFLKANTQSPIKP